MTEKREDLNFSSTVILTPGKLPLELPKYIPSHGDVQNDQEAYNPFDHRNVKYPNSDAKSLANLLKSSLGSGILAMPLAFKNSGMVVGVAATILIGYICTHCAQLLVKTSNEVCVLVKSPSLGYAETCEQVFAHGPKRLRKYSGVSRVTIDIALSFTYLGACCVYVVLVANTMKKLVDQYTDQFDYTGQAYSIFIMLPLILLVQIKSLSYLAPISAMANIFLVAVFGITLYYIFDGLPDIGERKLVNDITNLPSFISIVIFAMEGIGIVMPVENSMKNPRHFLGCPGVLNISMAIVVILYAVLGFLGYWKFGEDVMGSVTLNLDINSIGSQVTQFLIIIAIFCTYALQFYIPIEIAWKYLKPRVPKKCKGLSQVFLRAFCVVLTVGFAIAIPKLDAIIGLIGAIFYSTLGLLIPALIQIIHRWNRNLGRWNWILWKNTIIMIAALVALISGVNQSIIDMNKE